ncbi:kinase-like domain-containing protein [Rhizophagus irregularis DAOM 181602=DAOM 197198]|uniref:Kinase-like domain-containing protein n=1 Tax=Rhizophagus irregularis (strain DAOM 181602 / DAOM 197198 / MUCL 43194) TaxID=747089 RepID=A0A2P4PR82_RHIID|nr:kinase-like domain-containing protein [Rhizophagus irregularis DAOM 181602=DAOM 197198]POG67882.1 kinase-like domain-containing protein [Rhizophagus irregularis DAOM 181602=DAOM 197198]|eukprot:XP_025174748.1 kinase-like domain-containing protein [Rhizophagus irregularis DAOM 181602=DAOM 197198]
MMVMPYSKDGSLRQQKLNSLQRIANGLEDIHSQGLIHHNIHCGNILNHDGYIRITGLGLCRPANVKSSQDEYKKVYGVLPYVAPEVCTGLPPYHDIAHDKILAISICKGLRPKSDYKVPQLILDIIKQCWDADPLKRPKAQELYKLVDNLYDELYNSNYDDDSEIKKQAEEAVKFNEKFTSSSLPYNGTTLLYTTNPQAVYTSRLLDFKNLPEPKNAVDDKDDDNSFEYLGN